MKKRWYFEFCGKDEFPFFVWFNVGVVIGPFMVWRDYE